MHANFTLSFLLGVISILSQLILIRETVTTFSGNELILSIVLGGWLISVATGTFAGKRLKIVRRDFIFHLFFLAAILLPVQICYLRYLRGVIALSGLPSIDFIVFHILIVLSPSTLIFGMLFSLISLIEAEVEKVSKLYVYECLGSAVGSLLFVILQKANLSSITIAVTIIIMSNAFLLIFFDGTFKKAISGATIIAGIIVNFTGIEKLTLRPSFPGQTILMERGTPYGTIVLTQSENQMNLYENGVLLTTTHDPIIREETCHYIMLQRPYAKDVLLIGGIYSGVIEELKKYNVEHIDYIDIDPELVKTSMSITPAKKYLSSIQIEDVRKFLREQKHKYDVIILISPEPLSGALNRFFTVEFFTEAKKNLSEDGVIGFSLGGSETYLGNEMRKLHSSVYKALHLTFKEVLALPGKKIFYLASDGTLTDKIIERHRSVRLNTLYVNPAYLLGTITEERLNQIKKWLVTDAKPNRDLFPSAYRYYLDSWLKEFSQSKSFAFLIIAVLLFFSTYSIVASRIPAISFVAFSTGFTGISMEVILLLIFQIIYSTLYLDIGLLFFAFMSGMAGGGLLIKKFNPKNFVVLTEFLILIMPLIIAVFIVASDLHSISGFYSRALFGIFMFTTALFAGAQIYQLFPAISNDIQDALRGVYSNDLVGACIGALLIGIVIIPSLGVVNSLILLSAVKLTSVIFLLLHIYGKEITLPRRVWHLWITMSFVLVVAGSLILYNNMFLYDFSRSKIYAFIVMGCLIITLVLSTGWFKIALTSWFRFIQFLVLFLVAFYPLFRCFFKIPYLFCHVCPRQCSFGLFRKYIVITSSVTNITTWPFCHTTCPIGIMYDAQPLSPKRVTTEFIKKLHTIRLVILMLLPFIYFKSKIDYESLISGSFDLFNYMFLNRYSINYWVVGFLVLFIAGGFFIPRLFCNLLCPIGGLKKLLEKTKITDAE